MADAKNIVQSELPHAIVKEHSHKRTLETLEFYPNHEPRTHEAHFHLFSQARKRLEKLGALKCWRCGRDEAESGSPIELHHSIIENALMMGIDLEKFKHYWPEFHVESDEDFMKFVESEANLLPLCLGCHRGAEGIHAVLYAPWLAGRAWKDELPRPAVVLKSE
jgi:hypothetical protein